MATSTLKLFTVANLRCLGLVNNTKSPGYTLSPTQHRGFFRNLPLLLICLKINSELFLLANQMKAQGLKKLVAYDSLICIC